MILIPWSSTSVTSNVIGNNYRVGERVIIDVTSLGGGAEQPGDLTFNVAKERIINVAMSNTFDFGGHNATLVFKKL